MNENLAVALGWIGCFVAVCSYLGVRAWVEAQRREREAYYRNDAIKKLAEMQGVVSEPVLALLREALKPPPEKPPAPWSMTPGQFREFYKSETMKRIADGANPDAVLAVMREEERRSARRTREGLKLAGLILVGIGAGLLFFLRDLVPDMPVYLVGLIPGLVGAALLSYALLFGAQE